MDLRHVLNLTSRQVRLAYHQDGLQLHHPPVIEKKWEPENTSRERLHPRPSPPEPQLIPIPMSDGEDDDEQPPQGERQRGRSRSRERAHPPVQVPQEPQIQPMVTPEPDDNISDDEFTVINPSSPSSGPPLSAEQRGRSRRDERSRSRERVPPHSSSHASQQPQPVVPPSGVQQTQTLATQGEDEDSATVDPQKRVSDRSRSPQDQEDSRRQGPQPQKGKKTVAEKQPSTPPKAKKHKSMDADEDDQEPQNEPGTSFNCSTYQFDLFIKDQQPVRKDQQPVHKDQQPAPTLKMKTVSTATSTVHKVRTLEEQYSIQISTS